MFSGLISYEFQKTQSIRASVHKPKQYHFDYNLVLPYFRCDSGSLLKCPSTTVLVGVHIHLLYTYFYTTFVLSKL